MTNPGTVAVLGAGGGGRASAVHLGRQGWTVRLWEDARFAANLADLTDALRGEGIFSETVPLALVTTDLAAAVTGADLVVACVQRGAHRLIAETLAATLTPEQTLLLNPGSLGGALETARIFREAGRPLPLLGETSTLTHCARPLPGGVRVTLEARWIKVAAFPGQRTAELHAQLSPLYPYLQPAASVLETGLLNANPVIHPPLALLNAAAIETNDGTFRFYGDGMSPAVAALITALDAERHLLGAQFGLDIPADVDVSVWQGYADSHDPLGCYRDSEVFAPLIAPSTLDHRYLHEDVGEGLVTWLALAEVAGIRLPTVAAIVQVASVVSGVDYRARTADRLRILGLGDMDQARMQEYVRTAK